MTRTTSLLNAAWLGLALAAAAPIDARAQTLADPLPDMPLLRAATEPDDTDVEPVEQVRDIRKAKPEDIAPVQSGIFRKTEKDVDSAAAGNLFPVRRVSGGNTRQPATDTGDDGAAAADDLYADPPAPPPLSQPANITRQLDAPPASASLQEQRTGAAIPGRQDPKVQEPVASLPAPPVYELSGAGAAAETDADATTTGSTEPEDPYAPLGIPVGAFRLFPTLELRGGITSNPGGKGDAGDASTLTRVTPELLIQSDWSRHSLEADLRGTFGTYTDSAGTDDQDLSGVLRGRIDINRDTDLTVEAGYTYDRLQRGETGAPDTVRTRPYKRTRSLNADLNHRFNRLSVTLSGGVSEYDYQNTTNRDGTRLDNGDLDYRTEEVKLRGGYDISPKTEIFAEVFADRDIYRRKTDTGGTKQGSTGFGGRAGAIWRPTPLVELNGSIGAEARDFRDPGSKRVSSLLLDGGVVWRPRPGLTLDLGLRQSLETSSENGASGGVQVREADLAITYELRPTITLTGGLLYGRDSYETSSREDERVTASAGLVYQFSRYIAFVADIVHDRVNSSAPGQSDNVTEATAGFRLRY